jgi:hypothetical protein
MQLLVFPLFSYTLQISIHNLDSLPHLAFILWRVLPTDQCFHSFSGILIPYPHVFLPVIANNFIKTPQNKPNLAIDFQRNIK